MHRKSQTDLRMHRLYQPLPLTHTLKHHLDQILLSSIFVHGLFDCANLLGVGSMGFNPSYSPYVLHACAALVTVFALIWSMIISRYNKVSQNHIETFSFNEFMHYMPPPILLPFPFLVRLLLGRGVFLIDNHFIRIFGTLLSSLNSTQLSWLLLHATFVFNTAPHVLLCSFYSIRPSFICAGLFLLKFKMESELGNREDDEDYDDASEIALLL